MNKNTEWKTVKFGDVVSLQQGLAFNNKNNHIIVDEGIPLLRITDLINNTKTKFVDKGKVNERFISKPTDIIFTRTGQVGLVFKGKIGIIHNNCFRVIPNKTIITHRDYIYWYLKQPEIIKHAQTLATGAAQPDLSHEAFKSIIFKYPNYATQRKITTILAAYDGLIENNLRRIKILEEMAQNLYRDWFVNFRFPGHEQTHFVDSPLGCIPEGWEVVPMKSVSNVVDCLHSKKPDVDNNGSGILIQLFNIGNGGKFDFSKKYLISKDDYVKWTKRIELSEGDCIITNVGRIAAVAQMPKGKKAALGRNMTGLRPIKGKITPTYLIEYLLSPHMASEVRRKSDSGVIMDSLNVRSIYLLSVPIPEGRLMDDFEYIARPIRQNIENLVEKNYFLRQTRDLLLPKLISGEVDVSDLDIKVPEEVAS